MCILVEKSHHHPGEFLLTTELLVEEPRERVFSFFADAFQLESITPPWLNFSVETPGPIEMAAGATIDYRLRLHGIPVRWRTRIGQWEPPLRFTDEQVKGPYRRWRHLHTFEETDAGTLVRDEVRYAFPLAFLLHPLIIGRDLKRIFAYRQQRMRTIFTPAIPHLQVLATDQDDAPGTE